MEQLNIYQRLALARIETQKKCTKKSGENKYAGFRYFELKDFLSIATEELAKNGLVALFNIKTVNDVGYGDSPNPILLNTQEIAELKITDGERDIIFQSPTAEANVKGANDIQNLGSKHTYLKRYLYMNALELSEGDAVDATIGKDEKKEEKPSKPATAAQITLLQKMGIDVPEGLTITQASDLIKEAKNGTN